MTSTSTRLSARAAFEQTRDVVVEFWMEADRARDKFGDQDHLPLGCGHSDYRVFADSRRAITNARAADGRVTWKDVLLEEVYEALAESDPQKVRAELVQVGAVAARMVLAIDRASS